MKKLVRLAAVTVMAFSLSTGLAAASTGSIGTTGPDSTNLVELRNRHRVDVDLDNDVDVDNVNVQSARTGDASVRRNTRGGSASTGDATNDNLTRTSVRLNNTGATRGAFDNACGCDNSTGTIRNTGPDSYNKVLVRNSSSVDLDIDNDVDVDNVSVQQATSGDARVTRNTTGGSARTGDATNVNTTETTVQINN